MIALAMVGLGGAPIIGAQDAEETYRAELEPVNADTTDAEISGEAQFTVSDNQLMIRVTVEGVAPDMAHLQHIHGFVEGDQEASCPTPDTDTNDDGVVDLLETEPMAGTTMIPLHGDPVSMEIVNDTYPTAGEDGTYTYEMTVPLDELQAAVAEQFPGEELDLEDRVVMVHGVPESTELPDTAESLGDIPAHVTLPIACGEIELVGAGTPEAATPAA